VLDLLRARFREKITLGELARRFRMAPTSFSSRFNRVTGRTLPRYVNELRAAEAERLLRETSLPVRRVAFEVGYENVTHFNAVFKRLRGKAPQAMRSNPGGRVAATGML
jgi:transcriptional regulator GlxA family with amidase domain